MSPLGIIPQDCHRGILVHYRQIPVTVVVKIAPHDGSPEHLLREKRSGFGRAIHESPAIKTEELRLHVPVIAPVPPIVDVPVGNEEVFVTILVEVGHDRSKTKTLVGQ